MNKRQLAERYLDQLGLNPDLIDDMFTVGTDDPELSGYFGSPKAQAYILLQRSIGEEASRDIILVD